MLEGYYIVGQVLTTRMFILNRIKLETVKEKNILQLLKSWFNIAPNEYDKFKIMMHSLIVVPLKNKGSTEMCIRVEKASITINY